MENKKIGMAINYNYHDYAIKNNNNYNFVFL